MSIKRVSLKESLAAIKPWLPVLMIFAGLLIFVIGRASVFPLENADEVEYMLRGYRRLLPAWGPLYSLWYRFLAYFSSDPVFIYRFNHGLLLFLSSLLVAIVLYLNGVEKTRASLSGAFLLCWYPWNAETFFVNHFNVVLILLALLATTKLREPSAKLLWFGALTFPLVYCRQNNLPASVGCVFLGLVFLRKAREKSRPRFHAATSLILICICSSLFFVWNPFKSSRAFAAFCGNLWRQAKPAGVTYAEFSSSQFGNVQSIGDAVFASPQIFLELFKENFAGLFDIKPYFHCHFEVWPAFALILGMLLLFVRRWSHETNDSRQFLTVNLGMVSFLFGISAFASVLIFGPKFHYYAEAAVLGGMFLVWYFSPNHQPTYAKQVLIAILVFAGFTYQANHTELWIRKFPAVTQEVSPIVETLQKIPAYRKKSFVLNNALPMFLGEKDWAVFGLDDKQDRTRKTPDQWLQQLREFKADVIVISQPFLKKLEIDYGWANQTIQISQLVGHCYDKFEVAVPDDVAYVHVRKKDCSD